MGRIGNFFSKIGRGIRRGVGWTSEHVIRPLSNVISSPAGGIILNTLGPVGKTISMAGRAVHAGYNIYDALKPKPKAIQPNIDKKISNT
jgi:hypothetical protein